MGIPAVPAAVAVVAGVVIAIVAILVRLMGRPIAVVGSGESRVGCCAERSGGGDLAAPDGCLRIVARRQKQDGVQAIDVMSLMRPRGYGALGWRGATEVQYVDL